MIHNDHLGTPNKMTDSTGTVVWAADYKPFGEVNITTNTITNNLRFPGQYFDAETGNHYNYRRDYNPVIGRYPQADPIGIDGGIGLYNYADNNPLIAIDPLGTCPESVRFGGFNSIDNYPQYDEKGKLKYTIYYEQMRAYDGKLKSKSGECNCENKIISCVYDMWEENSARQGKLYPSANNINWGTWKSRPAYLAGFFSVGWDCKNEKFKEPGKFTRTHWY